MANHRWDEEDAYAAATLVGLMQRLEELGQLENILELMTPEEQQQVEDAIRWHERHNR